MNNSSSLRCPRCRSPGSPAAEAGLQPGDIIIAAGGSPLTLPADLLAVLSNHQVGERITLSVVGPNGEARTLEVTLGEAPWGQGFLPPRLQELQGPV